LIIGISVDYKTRANGKLSKFGEDSLTQLTSFAHCMKKYFGKIASTFRSKQIYSDTCADMLIETKFAKSCLSRLMTYPLDPKIDNKANLDVWKWEDDKNIKMAPENLRTLNNNILKDYHDIVEIISGNVYQLMGYFMTVAYLNDKDLSPPIPPHVDQASASSRAAGGVDIVKNKDEKDVK